MPKKKLPRSYSSSSDAYLAALSQLQLTKSKKAAQAELSGSGTSREDDADETSAHPEPGLTGAIESRLAERIEARHFRNESDIKVLFSDERTKLLMWVIGVMVGLFALMFGVVYFVTNSIRDDIKDVRQELRVNAERLDRSQAALESRIRSLESRRPAPTR